MSGIHLHGSMKGEVSEKVISKEGWPFIRPVFFFRLVFYQAFQYIWSGLQLLAAQLSPEKNQLRHSKGTYQEMSSHVTHQGTLSHNHLSSLSHSGPMHELISTSKKKKKKCRQEMNGWIFSQNPCSRGNEWMNILPKSLQSRKKPLPLRPPPESPVMGMWLRVMTLLQVRRDSHLAVCHGSPLMGV